MNVECGLSLPPLESEKRELYREFMRDAFEEWQTRGRATGIILRDLDLAHHWWTKADIQMDS